MSVTSALRIGSGVVVWALHFALVYGATALACAQRRPELVPPIVGVASLAAAGACVAIAVRERGRREHFEHDVGASVAWLALVAIAWEACAALLAPACR